MQACQLDRHTGAQSAFQPIYPEERVVVETNRGPAGYINGQWFKWWEGTTKGYFARMAFKEAIKWWKDGDGKVHDIEQPLVVRTVTGARKYSPGGWSRRDQVFLGDLQIGVIKKSHDNLRGVTICLSNSAQIPGWQPQWCLNEHLMVSKQRQVDPSSSQLQ